MSTKPASAAPTGRTKPASVRWGKDPETAGDAALGHASQNKASPEGAKESVGWPVVKSGELLAFVTSGSRGWAKYYAESGPLFLRIGNLDHDSVALDLRDLQRVAPPAGAEGTRTKVQASDILISITADVGMIGLVPSTLGEAYISQHVALARPQPTVHPPYLAWCLTSPKAQRQFLQLQRGATKVGLGLDDIRAVDVPLPPLPEQRRIVAEIEKQFTRLEAGVAALRRVQANLKRYRAAVLKAACEGKLVPTEAELQKSGSGVPPLSSNKQRQDAASTFESGSALLARILTERRQNWQGRGQYKEPAAPITGHLPPCPAGWTTASLDQLTSPARPICYGILMPKENVATGVLFVKVKDMKGDMIDLEGLHRTSPAIAAKYARASLRTGDLLLSIRGTYGRVAEVPKELDGGNITQDTARLDVTGLVNRRYVATYPSGEVLWLRLASG